MEAVVAWGTWEDLVLGGAIMRHGTADWSVVASELRVRTIYPYAFTPEACKERYNDLQKRFDGSTAWFEELRKRRVAELKQELAKSENSIGSLESKIKSMEGEKQQTQQSKQSNHISSENESPLPAFDSEATESLSKQTSNGENSINSFTKETSTRVSYEHRSMETDRKSSTSACSKKEMDSTIEKFPEVGYGHGVVVRKKRGQRKRKDCSVKERSVGESDNLDSSSTAKKEILSHECERVMVSDTNNHHGGGSKATSLIEIFESVAESESAAVFRHRMDSQKRARYRRVIKQHMDIGTIKSRIAAKSIKSAKELFRDLLLLASNALVFYSRRTREYKSAVSLRQLVMREYKLHCRGYSHEATSAFIPCNPPVKPRTVRPRPNPRPPVSSPEKVSSNENVAPATAVGPGKRCDSDEQVLRQSSLKAKKGVKRPAKIKPELGDQPRRNTPVKQRKRVRR